MCKKNTPIAVLLLQKCPSSALSSPPTAFGNHANVGNSMTLCYVTAHNAITLGTANPALQPETYIAKHAAYALGNLSRAALQETRTTSSAKPALQQKHNHAIIPKLHGALH